MTKKEAIAKIKEAIAKIMESGTWREQDAISIVENEIKKDPDYLEKKIVPPKGLMAGDEGRPFYRRKVAPIRYPFAEEQELDRIYRQEEDWEDEIEELEDTLGREFKDKYGEEGDFVGEEGFLEGIYGDLFNDVESSADTEEDRLRRQIRRLNEERSHVFDDEMGYMEASDPLSYHGREQKRNLDNMREIEELAEALQRGEAGMLAGTEQTLDNRDLSLVQGNIEGALPEGLQGGLQAQVFDPASVSPYGISHQEIMEALQRSQRPQDQQGVDMAALERQRQLAMQRQMANSGMPQTLQYGGGQGPGTSYNRPQMYNPWRGNPQSRFQ